MRLAAHMLGFGVDRFAATAIKRLMPHVDKLFVAYSELPFSYSRDARARVRNPTPRSAFTSTGHGPAIEVIEGDWHKEEHARNACLRAARAQGFDWLLTVDADEFYTEASWQGIREALRRSYGRDHVVTTWYNFFKSSGYALIDRRGSLKSTNAGFALRCQPHLEFAHKRLANATRSVVVDCPCFHYGYVMTNDEMSMKLGTWSHSADFDAHRWFRLKWLRWTPSMRNLHPTNPPSWRRAVPFPLEQPDFAQEFAMPIAPPRNTSVVNAIEEQLYDFRAKGVEIARGLRASVVSVTAGKRR